TTAGWQRSNSAISSRQHVRPRRAFVADPDPARRETKQLATPPHLQARPARPHPEALDPRSHRSVYSLLATHTRAPGPRPCHSLRSASPARTDEPIETAAAALPRRAHRSIRRDLSTPR